MSLNDVRPKQLVNAEFMAILKRGGFIKEVEFARQGSATSGNTSTKQLCSFHFATPLTNMFDVLSWQIPLQIGALAANLGIAKCTVLNGIVLQHKEI